MATIAKIKRGEQIITTYLHSDSCSGEYLYYIAIVPLSLYTCVQYKLYK